MTPTEALSQLGGRATWSQLRRVTTERALSRAVREGSVVKVGRGRYVLPSVVGHRQAAARHTAVLSHLSAAVEHGWAVKWPPTRPWLTVPRKRKISHRGLEVTYRDLSERERARGITGFVRTVVDCARKLPFDEALAIADSALRAGDVTRDQLEAAARAANGPGATRVRRVVEAADGRAANPFESVLRAIVLGVPGLEARPQVQVADAGCFATVDLGDVRRRLAIEAESFAHHAQRDQLVRDCRRYTELATCGWTLLRFTWNDVMRRPAWVAWAIAACVAVQDGQPRPLPPREHGRAVAA